MKKTLVNLAITASLLAGAVSAQAAAGAQAVNENETSTAQYVGLGLGAATGAVVAGPVGLVIGGIVGALAGWNSDREQQADAGKTGIAVSDEIVPETAATIASLEFPPIQTPDDAPTDDLVVASTAAPDSVLTGETADHSTELRNILAGDLSLDVYFRSGSTSVEAFYAPRLQAIAALMRVMPMLEIHIDAYSDRRGNSDDNLRLSRQRLDAVRAQLQQSGIDESRIHGRAHGEGRFLSSPGDLEAYTFDRRVVIRFEQSVPSIADTEPESPETPVAAIDEVPML